VNVMKEAFGAALRKHREEERETLERIEREALQLERLPEGQEARNETVMVDGFEVPAPKRVRGTLSIRFRK
jgi:hypothetical protein